MDPNAFVPHNDLEKLLAEVMLGTVAAEDFVARLMAGDQIFMPIKEEKRTGTIYCTPTRLLEMDEGIYRVPRTSP